MRTGHKTSPEIIEQIQHLRKNLHKSVKEIQKLLGVSLTTVSKYCDPYPLSEEEKRTKNIEGYKNKMKEKRDTFYKEIAGASRIVVKLGSWQDRKERLTFSLEEALTDAGICFENIRLGKNQSVSVLPEKMVAYLRFVTEGRAGKPHVFIGDRKKLKEVSFVIAYFENYDLFFVYDKKDLLQRKQKNLIIDLKDKEAWHKIKGNKHGT